MSFRRADEPVLPHRLLGQRLPQLRDSAVRDVVGLAGGPCGADRLEHVRWNGEVRIAGLEPVHFLARRLGLEQPLTNLHDQAERDLGERVLGDGGRWHARALRNVRARGIENWGGRTRTCNFPINSRAVCQLTYTPSVKLGRAYRAAVDAFRAALQKRPPGQTWRALLQRYLHARASQVSRRGSD